MTGLVGDTIILECLATEAQLAGNVGVVWMSILADLPEGRYNTTCALNQTLILRNVSIQETDSYECTIEGVGLDFIQVMVMGKG